MFVYIDDIIIYSQDINEHRKHLNEIFKRLQDYGLVINERKCHFFTTQIPYLGLDFGPSGYRPPQQMVPKIDNYPIPQDKKGVQRFLGIINFYRTHIPCLAQIAAPLYDLIAKDNKFRWTSTEQAAFDHLKHLFNCRLVLAPLNSHGKMHLYTDASNIACGAVLMQAGLPVEFFSRKFTPCEQRYSTHEREALAMVTSILHFRNILLGMQFTVFTDHKALLQWMKKPPVNERHARWLIRLQDMNFDIVYLKGQENVLADFMSRPLGETKSSIQELADDLANNNKQTTSPGSQQTFQSPLTPSVNFITPNLQEPVIEYDHFYQCNIYHLF